MANTELTTSASIVTDAEISSVAQRLASAYGALVASRREYFKESVDEAERKVRADDDPEEQRRAIGEPAEEVSWWSLTPLIEADPEAGWAVWERVKAEARDELASGHRAALALCWDDSPWQRAMFLAIRQAFV